VLGATTCGGDEEKRDSDLEFLDQEAEGRRESEFLSLLLRGKGGKKNAT